MTVRLAASLTTALELVDATELASLPEPAPSGEDVADAVAAALVEFRSRPGAGVPSARLTHRGLHSTILPSVR
jgi:hypothetical protein